MRARTLSGAGAVGMFAVIAVGVAPLPVANAATVTTRSDRDRSPAIYYVAAPGERNDVSLAYVDGASTTRTRISDPGAVITASRRCRSIDAHTVVCGAVWSVRIAVGDLDDRVTPAEGYAEDLVVEGGPGNDVLHGTDSRFAADRLGGGGGQDQLYGRRGDDTLTDGDLDGAVGDAAPGPDTLDGGRGHGDTVSYAKRTEAVRVRAGTSANAGEPGEHDLIFEIEHIVGGAGNDLLLGDRRGNSLSGRAGNDVLVGRRGWDALSGGAGNDVLDGRRGWDQLYGDRGQDRLFGGRGADYLSGGAGVDALTCGGGDEDGVRNPRVREVLPRSCESVWFAWNDGADRGWSSHTYPRATTQRWWLRLSTFCPFIWDDEIVGCRGTVTMRETRGQHRLLALGHFSRSASGIDVNVPLALTAPGYRWWTGQLGRASATVSARLTAEHTPRRPFKWSIRPPPPR